MRLTRFSPFAVKRAAFSPYHRIRIFLISQAKSSILPPAFAAAPSLRTFSPPRRKTTDDFAPAPVPASTRDDFRRTLVAGTRFSYTSACNLPAILGFLSQRAQ